MSVIKASNISLEIELLDSDGYPEEVMATVDVYLHIDNSYGADADGNRASTAVFIEDFQLLTLDGIEYKHLDRTQREKADDAVNDALDDYDFSDYIMGRK